ncbi:2-dehydro-3-deoxygluconokinase [Microvirga sp. KLBC 81]|uniref:sugar kinase n=1 Tax=Microvirga sp. KLBC 81 TaxID=1862707 RepID=UPI000D522CE5|nr:sugar kinase [Microvirga sp. KLBC 81]PVE23074.1 2-dehydro-3-deoxygluconokinase [Microvirga sp. KLBC 81]
MKSIDLLAFGEPLMEFAEVQRDGERLYLPGFGGDVSNAAVAAARQGAKAAIFTALGRDFFGQDFLDLWRREGIDSSSVISRKDGRTGAYFISYGVDGHVFSYARAGSAASLITVDELPLIQIASARILHASGITQAISESCTDAVFAAINHAKANGTVVSYDTNLRLKLWPLERARAIIHGAAAMSDILLPGLDDARQLTGLESPEEICAFYLNLGCGVVALTMGKNGTMVATKEQREVIAAKPVEAVDATGAGDTFDGAFLAEWLLHRDPFRAAAYANAAAALSTLGKGAVAPMPHRAEVERFLQGA